MSRIATEELRRIVAEASPGPWELRDAESYNGRSTTYYLDVWDGDLNVIASEAHRAHGDGGRSNMRLIALAPQLAAEVLQLREALQALHHAVCGETGFAEAVRLNSGLAYPWPALDIADELARAALSPAPVMDAVKQGDAQ